MSPYPNDVDPDKRKRLGPGAIFILAIVLGGVLGVFLQALWGR